MTPSLWVTPWKVYENDRNTKDYASFHVHLHLGDGIVRETMSKGRLKDKLASVVS